MTDQSDQGMSRLWKHRCKNGCLVCMDGIEWSCRLCLVIGAQVAFYSSSTE